MGGETSKLFASDAYSGIASFGKTMSTIQLGIAIFISFTLFIVAFMLYNHKHVYTGITEGIILLSDCKHSYIGNNPVTTCYLTIKYTVEGKVYTNQIFSKNITYSKGQKIRVYYNPKNHSSIILQLFPYKYVSGIVTIVSIFIILLSWLHYYLAHRFKGVAAIGGISDISRLI
jgi:type IV secretory pathway TraG/TraD family ATPase VirD4